MTTDMEGGRVRTPLNRKPEGKLVLSKTWDCWSAGTRVEFIEYTDTVRGWPTSMLCRIMGEQVVIPLDYITERRTTEVR